MPSSRTHWTWEGPGRPVCSDVPCEEEARYYAKTLLGSWCLLCAKHFRQVGIGLGEGRGKRVLAPSDPSVRGGTIAEETASSGGRTS